MVEMASTSQVSLRSFSLFEEAYVIKEALALLFNKNR